MTGQEVWSSAGWRALAVSWLDSRLAEAGLRRTGEVTQPRLRPWGTVLTAPTTAGPVWLKVPAPDTVFEVGLYRVLDRVAAAWILPPIAVDLERGWVLLPDGGPPLAERYDAGAVAGALVEVLPRYGLFQRTVMPHVAELRAAGVVDMRAEVMPARFDEAVSVVGELLGRHGGAEEASVLRRVAARREAFVSWCDRLAGATVGPSLDHNDLHTENILGTGSAPRFYDWGDSVIAHPFSSMLVGLGFLRHQLGVGPGDPAVLRPRDAYLEVFGDLATRAELVAELELACQVAKVARALVWHRAVRAGAGEFALAPLSSLASVLSDDWSGLS